MANTRIGNSFYVDTAGTITDSTEKQVRVVYILMTSTAANAILLLADPNLEAGKSLKVPCRILADYTTQLFDFSENPILFPNGIKVTTLTNALACIVTTNSGG